MDTERSPTKPKAGVRQWFTNYWHPAKVDEPTVDPELPVLNEVQRVAEVFRYSVLSIEWWISPNGALREWLRLNTIVALMLGIPALLIVPPVTFLLAEFVTWTQLLVEIAKNLAVFPLLATLAIAILTGVVFGLRFLLRLLLHK